MKQNLHACAATGVSPWTLNVEMRTLIAALAVASVVLSVSVSADRYVQSVGMGSRAAAALHLILNGTTYKPRTPALVFP